MTITRFSGALAALALVSGASGSAQIASPMMASPSAAPGWSAATEAPALARPGDYRIGTSRLAVTISQRPSLGAQGLQQAAFQLPVRLFYPAAGDGEPAVYRHDVTVAGTPPVTVVEAGLAFAGAAPLRGATFPLVVVSHGFGGWDAHFSRICELIASHGYVVVSLDHADAPSTDVPGFLRSFGQVLMARPVDQRTAITALLALAARKDGALALVDPAKPVGIIGYSMGGYGALGTAGADYRPDAAPFAGLPEAARTALAQPSSVATKVGALVLLAPWGAQPEFRVWSEAALTRVKAPVLLIDGDRDDIVNYGQGVRWLFGALRGTDRRLLTFKGAAHNIAGNAVDLPADAPLDVVGFLREPVWRQERITQIDTHFIVAFLDQSLKRDRAAAAFLDVPVSDSDEAAWPVAFGEQVGGTRAGDGQPRYWRGFQRRWARGMIFEHKSPGD